jgi:hypothetical protein
MPTVSIHGQEPFPLLPLTFPAAISFSLPPISAMVLD